MKSVKFLALVVICMFLISVMLTQSIQAKWPDEDSVYKHVVYKEIRDVNFGAEYRFIIETDNGYVEQFFYVTEDYRLDSCEPSISVTAKKIYVKECPYSPCAVIDSIPKNKAVYVYSKIRIGNPPILWYKIGFSRFSNIDSDTRIKGFVEAKEFKDISASSYFTAVPAHVLAIDTLYVTKKTFLKLRPLEGEESSVKLKPGEQIDLLGGEGWGESIWLLIQINGNIGWVKADETNYDYKSGFWY